jgi:uncharacterized protein (DUF302 family)
MIMTAAHRNFASLSKYLRLSAMLLGGMIVPGTLAAAPLPQTQPNVEASAADGVLRVRSAYSFDATITRIEAAVRANKIRFFGEIDQANLAATAGIRLRPSKLLLFGNPPLGVQLLTSNPLAGLDWPVRMLVAQDADGKVWIGYTDFDYIARRYRITDRSAVIAMASKVSAMIARSATGGE